MKIAISGTCAAAVLLCAAMALGDDVPATIDSDTTWTVSASPYNINQDVTIAEGVTLTIEPGVTVFFTFQTSLFVHGELIAQGTEDTVILFTGDEPESVWARWGSVVFEDTSVDAQYENLDTYQSGSILEWCIFEWANNAVRVNASSPFIHRCVFRNNESQPDVELPGGGAILIENGAAPRVFENDFIDNAAGQISYGGAVYVTNAHPIIQDNTFQGNEAVYGGALATDLSAGPIVGNVFEDNLASVAKGGAVSFISTTSAFLNNTVSGNHADIEGGGVHVCVDCFPHSNPFVMDNTITDNTIDSTDASEGAAGFGTAYIRVFSNNNIHGNLRAGLPSDFGWFHELDEGYPEWVSERSIGNNWWGAIDETVIAETIFDGSDHPGYGTVTFEPILTEATSTVLPRVTITTRKLRYEDIGDDMPVFLTLYNPGSQRELELSLFIQYEDGPAIPLDVELDFPGVSSSSGVYTLTMPENSVYFTTLLSPTYAYEPALTHGFWHAAIFDPTTGSRVGDVCTIRFDLEQGGE